MFCGTSMLFLMFFFFVVVFFLSRLHCSARKRRFGSESAYVRSDLRLS